MVARKSRVSTIEQGVGFVQGFLTNMMDVMRELGVPFDVIHRLATPPGRATLEKMILVAHHDWSAEKWESRVLGADSDRVHRIGNLTDVDAMPPDHYLEHVSYDPLPIIEGIFDGRPWNHHSFCQGLDRKPGNRVFYAKSFDEEDGWNSLEAIAWGLRKRTAFAPGGYRPAIIQEGYEFCGAHPEFSKVAVLGSINMTDRIWRVALIGKDVKGKEAHQKNIALHEFDERWARSVSCLFVAN